MVRLVARAAVADRVTFLAASIAFYAVISIFPLVLLILVVGTLLGGEAFARAIIEIAGGLFTPEALAVLEEGLISDAGRSGAGVIGLIFMIWAGLKVFRGLDIAFSTVYGRGHDPTFLKTIINSVLVLAALGAGIAAMILIQAAGAMLDVGRPVQILSPVFIFLALVVLFFPLYFIFPGVRQRPIEVIPGTVFAAAGWTVLGELFGFYAAQAGTYALFGIVGGFLLLLMWFYFGAIILLVGAILNAVLAGRFSEEFLEAENTVERPIGAGLMSQDERDE